MLLTFIENFKHQNNLQKMLKYGKRSRRKSGSGAAKKICIAR